MATRRITIRRTIKVQVRREVRWRATVTPQYESFLAPTRSVTQIPATTRTHRQVISTFGGGGGLDDLYVAPPSPDREWDVFISYASEDKATVALLAEGLRSRGVSAWFDETELTIGKRLLRTIDYGLAHSRFGVTFMSHAFFAKEWPQRELAGIVALQVAGRQQVLPVWHGLTHEDVLGYSPTLADTIAARTSESTIEDIAEEIARVVLG